MNGLTICHFEEREARRFVSIDYAGLHARLRMREKRHAFSAQILNRITTGCRARVPRLRVGHVHYRNPSPAPLSSRQGCLAESSDEDLALQGGALVCTHKERCICMPEGSGCERCARNAQRAIN